MTREEKVKNILAFLSILFGEEYDLSTAIMKMNPDYLIEKFERYCLSDRPESDWGLHPSLRRVFFNKYCDKYDIEITGY